MRISSDWKNSKLFRQSDRDWNRGKTIRLRFKGKGEESSEEKCWREEKMQRWDIVEREFGRRVGGRVGYQSDGQAYFLHCSSYYTWHNSFNPCRQNSLKINN